MKNPCFHRLNIANELFQEPYRVEHHANVAVKSCFPLSLQNVLKSICEFRMIKSVDLYKWNNPWRHGNKILIFFQTGAYLRTIINSLGFFNKTKVHLDFAFHYKNFDSSRAAFDLMIISPEIYYYLADFLRLPFANGPRYHQCLLFQHRCI